MTEVGEVLSRGSGAEVAVGLRALWADDRATTTVEYALLLALIVASALAAFQALGRLSASEVDDAVQEIGGASMEDASRPGRVWPLAVG